MIEKGGIKIPKLDLTSIYMQREVVSSQNDEDESDEEDNESNSLMGGHSSDVGQQNVDSKGKKQKFEAQKQAFKEKMLMK